MRPASGYVLGRPASTPTKSASRANWMLWSCATTVQKSDGLGSAGAAGSSPTGSTRTHASVQAGVVKGA